jgi:tartrate-resistant acid phosphatase type 5
LARHHPTRCAHCGALALALVALACQHRRKEESALALGAEAESRETPVTPLPLRSPAVPAPLGLSSGPSLWSAPAAPSTPVPSNAPSAEPDLPGAFRFAVIGDYGVAGPAERQVAELVRAFKPEIVITTGDNNYPSGGADTIDDNIGQFYSEFIGHYRGKYGHGSGKNRFYPALGNHDWYTDGARPYLDYFTLPGNERYYTFSAGPVDFFALDSDPNEPDGTTVTSKQAAWLEAEAGKAHGAWQLAYMHHPPYSSGPHGSSAETEWPYQKWGVDLVLAGHDHTYERAVVDGLTFLVNGLGGAPEYEFKRAIPNSLFRYQAKHGAQLALATAKELRITFVAVDGTRVDEVTLHHD